MVLDELARERLAEGRQLLTAMLSEHDRLRQDVRKGPRPGDIDREALRAHDEWDPADRKRRPVRDPWTARPGRR